MCAPVFHQWLHKYCALKLQLFLAYRRNTYLSSQLRGGQTISALRLIMQSSKTERKTSSITSAAWHEAPCSPLKPNVANIILLNFCAPNNDSFWVCRIFNVCVRVSCTPNATILFAYLPAKIKLSFIWKDDFFFCQNRHLLWVNHRPS